MNLKDIRKNVILVLEKEGVFIDDDYADDIDVTNLLEDSIQFISIIVRLEEEFSIEIPSELLILDNFKSLEHICEIIQSLIKTESKV